MNEAQQKIFEDTKECDFARFRVNVFNQRRSVGVILRRIPSEIPTIDGKRTSAIEVMVNTLHITELILQGKFEK